jgi:Kef-type K+ transport system membrane component KefB
MGILIILAHRVHLLSYMFLDYDIMYRVAIGVVVVAPSTTILLRPLHEYPQAP